MPTEHEPRQASWRDKGEVKERKKAPHTKVKSAGRVSQRLEVLAELYLRDRPTKAVRWVYHPSHKPELSNVTSRNIDGYVLVHVKDLGDDTAALLPGLEQDDLVRVGDVIMMSIDADVRRDLQEDLDQSAVDERVRVEQEFYHAIEEVKLEKGMRDEYQPRPMGQSVTEEVEIEVEGPETHRES